MGREPGRGPPERLKAVEKAGGAPFEAELHRLKGEALLAGAGAVSEAEPAIEKGIDVARRHNAKSWELRGAMSLARLWAEQGRHSEAGDLLAPGPADRPAWAEIRRSLRRKQRRCGPATRAIYPLPRSPRMGEAARQPPRGGPCALFAAAERRVESRRASHSRGSLVHHFGRGAHMAQARRSGRNRRARPRPVTDDTDRHAFPIPLRRA
jgi:hypothetical protein